MRGHNPLSKYKNPSQFNRCFNEIQSNLYQEVTFGTKKNRPYKTGGLLKRFNSNEIF